MLKALAFTSVLTYMIDFSDFMGILVFWIPLQFIVLNFCFCLFRINNIPCCFTHLEYRAILIFMDTIKTAYIIIHCGLYTFFMNFKSLLLELAHYEFVVLKYTLWIFNFDPSGLYLIVWFMSVMHCLLISLIMFLFSECFTILTILFLVLV